MGGIAAGHVGGAAELARLEAEIFLAALAGRAIAAADPGKGRIAVADLHALGIGADGHHFALDLMAERVRQLHAPQRQLVAAAQIEIAVMDMNVGMADAGVLDLQQHLGALGLRRRAFDGLKRLSEFDNGLAEHRARLPKIFEF